MRNSCAVCSLAVVLCLVVCVSASTTVNQEEATAAVGDAQRTVTTVRERAQKEFDDAQSVLQKVESSKSAAEIAVSKSQAAANDNEEAKAIAENIKILSDEVFNFHSEAKQKLDTAVSTLTELLASAKDLESKSTIEIKPNPESSDDYTGANSEAETLKGQADALNGQIDAAVQPISGFDSKADDMVKKAKQAQLKDAHVSVVVAVAKIKSMLENADTTIEQIDRKKNEVNGTVYQMQTLKTNAPTVSNKNIEALHQSAANALRDATDALDSAKISRAAIQTQKDIANEALTKVQPETQKGVSEAQKEVQKAEECVRAAQQSFTQLATAMQTATNSVTNAKTLKQKLMKALSTTTTAPSTVQATETKKANPPVGQGTERDQKDTTIQPTSKELPSQSNNSAEEIKDALINSAQNVPTTALTGGKAPAPGAKNDSAMTVSVPLLVALIASAVLQ